MLDHTFLNLQITKSDITWPVSLVIAYGRFSLHQPFVWVCMTTGSILTLASKRGMIKLSDIIKTLDLQPLCSLWVYILLIQYHYICSTQDVWNACVIVCNIYTLELSHFIKLNALSGLLNNTQS